ncbi:hypothetical protein GCM10007203_16710 [Staphylococcus nepalensis]|jgi:hypothetical protein|nr:hypothetical protein GCM10007203_16710 [Staphylococcus nepalensis]
MHELLFIKNNLQDSYDTLINKDKFVIAILAQTYSVKIQVHKLHNQMTLYVSTYWIPAKLYL